MSLLSCNPLMMDTESKTKPLEGDPFSNPQLKIEDLPSWEAVEYEPLARAAPWESFFHSCIGFTVLLIFGFGSSVVSSAPLFITLGVVLIVLLLFALTQWHNFAEHKVRGVAVREKDVLFRKGLFWQERSVLPFNRVQHIETHRNPIERHLGLSSLRVFTAGGSGVDLQIKGLENHRADQIKQYMLERARVAAAGKASIPTKTSSDERSEA